MGTSEIRSVARALEILDVLASAPSGVRVTDLAAEVGVDKSTVSRLLGTLVGHGFATRLPDRRYTVGSHALRLYADQAGRLARRVAPAIAGLDALRDETVHLLRRIGTEAVVVGRLVSPRGPVGEAELHPAFPLYATAGGHALLARSRASERRALLPAEPFPALTPQTPRTVEAVWRLIRRGQRRGVFREEGMVDPGVSCVAVSLWEGARPLALSVCFDRETPRPRRDRVARDLRHAAELLAEA